MRSFKFPFDKLHQELYIAAGLALSAVFCGIMGEPVPTVALLICTGIMLFVALLEWVEPSDQTKW